MRVCVFGASGRVGSHAAQYLREAGHEVTAVVRDRRRLPAHAVVDRVLEADVLDAQAVGAAVAGADAVVSALASAGLEAPGTVLSQGARNLVTALQASAGRRILAVASSGVLDVEGGGLRRDQPGYPALFLPVSREHEQTWRVLAASGLEWTLVCPPNMPTGERTGRYRTRADRLPEGGREISAEDVADFLARELGERRFIATRVGISY